MITQSVKLFLLQFEVRCLSPRGQEETMNPFRPVLGSELRVATDCLFMNKTKPEFFESYNTAGQFSFDPIHTNSTSDA